MEKFKALFGGSNIDRHVNRFGWIHVRVRQLQHALATTLHCNGITLQSLRHCFAGANKTDDPAVKVISEKSAFKAVVADEFSGGRFHSFQVYRG